MKLVKIICGGYGLPRPHGGKRLILAGQTVALNDTEAERLIALGHAAPVATEESADFGSEPGANTPSEENVLEQREISKDDLLQLTNAQLRELATKLGLDPKPNQKKTYYVDLIASANVELAVVSDDDAEEGAELPDIGAEAPVV